MGDLEATAAVPEGRDAELGVPARLEHSGAEPERRDGALDGLDAAGERARGGVRLVRAPGRLLLQHLDLDLGAGGVGRIADDAGQPFQLLLELLLRVEAAVEREPRRARHDVEAGPGPGLPADDQHRVLREQLAGQGGQRLGDADHVLEGVDALVDVAHVRLAPRGPHAQRDGAAARVPDHAAGRLGDEHGGGAGVDQPRLAQVPRAGGATGLLVADEVEDDPAPVEQAELARGRRAVEHRDQAALHVRRAAPDDPAVAALGLELRRALRGDDVEVPVVVHELGPAAGAAAHDRRSLDLLRREAEPVHLVAQQAGAARQLAAGRVLGRDPHELLEQRRHLVSPPVEPGQQVRVHADCIVTRRRVERWGAPSSGRGARAHDLTEAT